MRRTIRSDPGTVPNWPDHVYEVRDVEQIEHDGVRGSAATATFKPIPELPSRASEMMNVFYLLETPVIG